MLNYIDDKAGMVEAVAKPSKMILQFFLQASGKV
jgi:hypothetical protein